jgi:hypothetical protein
MRKILILAFVAAFAALGTASVAGASKSRDRDRDKLPDKWEKKYKLSTKSKATPRQDNDGDGLNNRGEFQVGDNPRDADTDNDGVEDGNENSGTIESFDPATGKLVITLAPNGRLEGKVDATTEIECDKPGTTPPATTSSRDDEGDDDSGPSSPNSGPGSPNSGPGSPGDNEPGDDERDGDNNNDDANDDENGNCTTADLKPGAKVDEAEIGGNGIFKKVELDS